MKMPPAVAEVNILSRNVEYCKKQQLVGQTSLCPVLVPSYAPRQPFCEPLFTQAKWWMCSPKKGALWKNSDHVVFKSAGKQESGGARVLGQRIRAAQNPSQCSGRNDIKSVFQSSFLKL
jgi:hypothetical protein